MARPSNRPRRRLSEEQRPYQPLQTAKLFKNGRSQAVRLPKEFRFEGDEVYVKRVGGGVVLLSKDDPWASIADAYALADRKHPIRRHKTPPQKRSFKWP
jgi:antitoxin VapB